MLRWQVILALLVAVLVFVAGATHVPTGISEVIGATNNGFRLPIIAANCQRLPTVPPFEGGDCVPATGAVIVVATEDGELVATHVATSEDSSSSAVASCTVTVPFGAIVIVTEDITTLSDGYAPQTNTQRWPIPAGPPDGEFGGPIFLYLHQLSSATPPTTATPTPTGPPSACTGPPYPTPMLNPDLNLPGYVGLYYDGALFVEWTEVGSSLSGTLYQTVPDARSLDGLKSESYSLTGVQSGNRVTFTLSVELGYTLTLPGLLDGETLTLYFTDNNGSSVATTLHRSTLAGYEQAVQSLRLQAAQTTACAQEAGATATTIATQQNKVTDANTALDGALKRLANDVESLREDTGFTDVLDAYALDWEDMQNDDRTMRADADLTPLDCVQLGAVEVDLGILEVDLGHIEVDDGSLEVVTTTVTDDITAVEQDIADVEASFDALQTAVAANTTGMPAPEFTQEDVDQAMNAAQEQIDASKTAIQSAQEQAATYDQEAADLFAQAQEFVAGLICSD